MLKVVNGEHDEEHVKVVVEEPEVVRLYVYYLKKWKFLESSCEHLLFKKTYLTIDLTSTTCSVYAIITSTNATNPTL